MAEKYGSTAVFPVFSVASTWGLVGRTALAGGVASIEPVQVPSPVSVWFESGIEVSWKAPPSIAPCHALALAWYIHHAHGT